MRESAKPFISIIVPVYNAEQYLDQCVQSILSQDYVRFELLLVNDGSTDRSGELCDSWAGKDRRVRVLNQRNAGQSCARNRGLEEAKGEYVSFVDADDYVTSDYLSYLLSLYQDFGQCRVTACNHFITRGHHTAPNAERSEEKSLFPSRGAMESALFHGCIDVSPWAKLYHKDVFAMLRYPEKRIFEDTWLFGDILRQTWGIIYGHRCCYYYQVNKDSTVRKAFSVRNLQYIEAAQKLAADALRYGKDMETGGIRRINHARLSVLRYMQHCDRQYLGLRKQLREAVLKDAPRYIQDPRTPERDRRAVALLQRGLFPYYLGWRIYSLFR